MERCDGRGPTCNAPPSRRKTNPPAG